MNILIINGSPWKGDINNTDALNDAYKLGLSI